MGTKVYFFKGPKYLRYDRGDDVTDKRYPLDIGDNWPGFRSAGFDTGIDAALNLEGGKVYLFRGPRYLRYDTTSGQADAGFPLPIAGQWPGFAEAGFADGVDAAVNWGNGKAYVFRGSRYLRYDIALDKVDDGFPLPIALHWPGFAAAGFGDGIDAAVNWGDGKVFFFRRDRYLRYDIAEDRVDDGYPLPIAGFWPGFAEAGFGERVRAATDLYDARSVFLPDAETMLPPVNGPRYVALPWRGVLHTTEGPTIQGALASFRQTNFWPTLTIEPNTFRVVQHYSLSRGARALSDHATVENAARCVQIEIVGFADGTPSWAPEKLAFVREVMRSIEDLVPIPRRSGRAFLDLAGVTANPGNRMTVAEWKRFSGWCGHQHVPGESHWDPGGIDIDTLLA
jgi:hypothetical protein